MLALTLAWVPARSQVTRGGEWRDDVARFAQSLVEAQLIPGMGMAVTQGDTVVYSRSLGSPIERATRR